MVSICTLCALQHAVHHRHELTPKRKTPGRLPCRGVLFESLAVTYSCMDEVQTTIGAERFHFRVRKGIGWFPLAMAARQTGSCTPLARGHRIRIGV